MPKLVILFKRMVGKFLLLAGAGMTKKMEMVRTTVSSMVTSKHTGIRTGKVKTEMEQVVHCPSGL